MQDVYDIKMPCHLLLAKVAAKAGDQLLASIDKLVPALEKTLSAKVRAEAVKQEVLSKQSQYSLDNMP